MILPLALRLVNTPTEVMLACAFDVTVPAVAAEVALAAEVANVALATVPVTLAPATELAVPAVVAVVAEPALVANVALATVPVTFAPGNDVNPVPDPKCVPVILAPVMLPELLNEVKIPTEVMFACAAVVTVPAEVANVALATVPLTLAPATALAVAAVVADVAVAALVAKVALATVPLTLAPATELAVAAVVAEPALVAKVALATVPITLAPVIELRPDPLPTKNGAVTLPVVVIGMLTLLAR